MDDKELLVQDMNGTAKENLTDDAVTPKSDSQPNNEANASPSVAAEESSAADAAPNPKRKYTRKAAVKRTDAPESNSDGKEPVETPKKTRSVKKKKTAEAVEPADALEKLEPENESAKPPLENMTENTLSDELSESPDLPEISEENNASDSAVQEEFSFIPELTSLIFESSFEDTPLTDDSDSKSGDDNDEVEEDNKILPPDELFADMCREATAPNESEQPVEDTADTGEIISDTAMDDDGQYRFAELEESIEEPLAPAAVDAEPEKYDPKKPRRIDGRFDLVELFIFTLLAVMVLTSFFFRHSIVDGESMENTLYSGEHLIISDLFYTPKRGDIIVCEDYTTALSKPIVKRVIAVAGDTVEIKRSGRIYVNGVLLEEEYVYLDDPFYSYKDLTTKVPDGEIFVMGDHRNASTDSRDIGTVSEDSVLGKVLIRFYPFDKFGVVK